MSGCGEKDHDAHKNGEQNSSQYTFYIESYEFLQKVKCKKLLKCFFKFEKNKLLVECL